MKSAASFVVGLSFLVASIALAGPAVAAAPVSAATLERLHAASAPLTVANGSLQGTGAAILADATANANFVLVGEDHGTVETPRFCDALFGVLAGHGFETLAVETGPLVARHIQDWARDPRGAQAFSTFEAAYPGTTAFYSWREEFDFLQHAAARTNGRLRVWGLDQELMGAPGFLFDAILEQRPGERSTALARALRRENDDDYGIAARTGSPADTFMVRADEAKLLELQQSLQRDGNANAQSIAQGLLDSYRIYKNCCNELAQTSNIERASLMKRTLDAYLRADAPAVPKIMFKFGEEHMYRGFNPNRYLDLGNFVAERADGARQTSARILVLGIGGEQSVFAGIGKPWRRAAYSLLDADHARFHFLEPLIRQADAQSWTVVDLRRLRSHFGALGIGDPGFERLVFGYDVLVLVPHTTADEALDPSVF